jgi:hypothetical protein
VRQDPFPSPGWDGKEPDGSVPPPVTGNGPGAGNPGRPAVPGSGGEWPGDDPDAGAGAEQGLFVCLPAEDLDVSRFAQHGQSDSMPPGPLLASVVHALTGTAVTGWLPCPMTSWSASLRPPGGWNPGSPGPSWPRWPSLPPAVPPTLQAGTAAALGPGRRRASSPLTSWPPSCA